MEASSRFCRKSKFHLEVTGGDIVHSNLNTEAVSVLNEDPHVVGGHDSISFHFLVMSL